MTLKASKHHQNRGWHNWSLYNSLDRVVWQYRSKIQGEVYDLGCGDSIYKDFVLTLAENYIGVDWENSLHESNPEVVADLNEVLPIPTSSADTVLCISTLEHLREPKDFLHEVSRILKPSGTLLLQVPWQWHIHEEPYDYFRFSTYGLSYLLESSGFKRIEVIPQLGFFSTMALKVNYFTKRVVRGPSLIQTTLKLLLLPIWTIGQVVGGVLDRLDRNWSAETAGYFIIASKIKGSD